ncbi:MAG TPA: outer membrane lipoprotein chaperone LolA [Thermodesulfobacteriota bacterium]|nr:outer membrane lipoprotein chaperone LolA [Thermodesulfobacteriota bacterium]
MNKHISIMYRQNFSQIFSYNIILPLIFFLSLTCFCLSFRTSLADENGGENIVSSVQQKYKGINSVEANFVQTNYIASLNQSREFRGKIFLEKPNLFNMEVSHPAKQRQTFDGQYLWVYTHANNQVLKNLVSPDFLHHPFINLLSTMENLERDFFISGCSGGGASDPSLKLTLKKKYSELREVLITLERKGYQIQTVTLYYESGNYTRLALSKIKENQKISPQYFHFIPPAGVEVVEPPAPQTRQ